MPYLTNLADVARRSGLKVVEVPGWKSRGRGPMSSVKTITCHHTATPRSFKKSASYPTMAVVRDGRPGIPGPLSQLGLGRDGTVYVIAAGRANHAGVSTRSTQTNSYAIGIEAEGAMESWPAAQYNAYVRLVAALKTEWPDADIVGHKESASPAGRKSDPSFNMSSFRDAVGRVNLKAKPTPATPAKPKGLLEIMTKKIAARRTKDVKIDPGNKFVHLPLDDKGNFTAASGPATASAAHKVDIFVPKGATVYVSQIEALYKDKAPTVIGRELATLRIVGVGRTETVTVGGAVWNLPGSYKGRQGRLRLAVKTGQKGVIVKDVVTSGTTS